MSMLYSKNPTHTHTHQRKEIKHIHSMQTLEAFGSHSVVWYRETQHPGDRKINT